MKVLQFTSLCIAAAILTMTLAALAVDAYLWEMDGSCFDSVIIHHIQDCRP